MQRHRRGQRGRIGPIGLIFLLVAGYTGYVFSDFLSSQWQWYKLRRDVLDIARFSIGKDTGSLAASCIQAAKKLGIQNITPPQITREVHTDAKAQIIFEYQRKIDYRQFGVKDRKFKVDVYQGLPMAEGHF